MRRGRRSLTQPKGKDKVHNRLYTRWLCFVHCLQDKDIQMADCSLKLHKGYSEGFSADLCCRRYDEGVRGRYCNSLIHDLTEKCHSRTTAKGREMLQG